MKKFNLFLIASAATALVACSDYVGELNDKHDEFVTKIEEAQTEKALQCTCDFASLDGLIDGFVYDVNSGVDVVRWTISDCWAGFSLEDGLPSVFGAENIVRDPETDRDLVQLSLSDDVKNGLIAGSYQPFINLEYNGKTAQITDCPAVSFVMGGKLSSSSEVLSSSSSEVTSSSSSLVESSSSEDLSSSSVEVHLGTCSVNRNLDNETLHVGDTVYYKIVFNKENEAGISAKELLTVDFRWTDYPDGIQIGEETSRQSYSVILSKETSRGQYYAPSLAIYYLGETYNIECDPHTVSGAVVNSKYLNPDVVYDSVQDKRDHQWYKTVMIANLRWMAQNLNYAADGSHCTNPYMEHFETPVNTCISYGREYNWETAKTVCPEGWHLPSQAEYRALFNLVGHEDGKQVKLFAKTELWYNAYNDTILGTDNYGFSALPTWYDDDAWFWTSTPAPMKNNAMAAELSVRVGFRSDFEKTDAFPVRCVGDYTQNIQKDTVRIENKCYARNSEIIGSYKDTSLTELSVCPDSLRAVIYGCWCDVDKAQLFEGETATWSVYGCTSSREVDYEWTGVTNGGYGSSASHTFTSAGSVAPTLQVSNGDDVAVITCPTVEAIAPLNGSFTDIRDYHEYKTVTIGTQTWMAENLNYNHEGMPDNNQCYGNDEDNCDKYGRLYTWSAAVDSVGLASKYGLTCGLGKSCDLASVGTVQGVCPEGWHLPDSTEYNTLLSYVGYANGYKLMAKGDVWEDGSGNSVSGSDEYGFNALPAGMVSATKSSLYAGNSSYFWTSSQSFTGDEIRGGEARAVTTEKNAAFYWLSGNGITQSGSNYHSFVRRDNNSKGFFFSVRCVKN